MILSYENDVLWTSFWTKLSTNLFFIISYKIVFVTLISMFNAYATLDSVDTWI